MIDATLRHVPVAGRFAVIYVVLGAIAVVAAFVTGLLAHAPTITHTKRVVSAPGSGAALIAAWGAGDSSVPGEQVNPNLKGLTCHVYQAKRAIVCA
jgi:hypothetical protein